MSLYYVNTDNQFCRSDYLDYVPIILRNPNMESIEEQIPVDEDRTILPCQMNQPHIEEEISISTPKQKKVTSK